MSKTLIALLLLSLCSCVKDTQTPINEVPLSNPVLVIDFKALINKNNLVQGKLYSNTSLDSFTVTKFNYYISNIKLSSSINGQVFTEPESYHLIKHVEGQTSFTITNVTEGNYTSIQFLIGVDSLRNVSGAQTGALDPANQMFWEWSSGYIFYKLEGDFKTLLQPEKQGYAIHIGGFTGKYSCLQSATLNLNGGLITSKGKTTKLHLNTNVEEVFTKPVKIGFEYYYDNINAPMFKMISDNYKDMFEVASIEN